LTVVALVAWGIWAFASSGPDTYRELLADRAGRFAEIRAQLTHVADTLPRTGQGGQCPREFRYSTDELASPDNNAAFLMESQLRQPEIRLDHAKDFDLLVGPPRSNLVVKFHHIGPEPGFNIDKELVLPEDWEEEADVALDFDFVVVTRVLRYEQETVDPDEVDLETFVLRADSGAVLCSVRVHAEAEQKIWVSASGDEPVTSEGVEYIPAALQALSNKAREELQRQLHAAGAGAVDLSSARTYGPN
jgi:hypothetical protein